MGNKKETGVKAKVFEVVDATETTEPLDGEMPLFKLLPPNRGTFTEVLKTPYNYDESIKMPSLTKQGGPEGLIIRFEKRLYDPNKDPQLIGNRELQEATISMLKASPNFGVAFTIYNPDDDIVTMTRGEQKELEALREAKERAQEQETN